MRLVDLHPECRVVYVDQDKTPDKGGIPNGEIDLAFDCPACGGPHRIFVRLGPSMQKPEDNAGHRRRWAWSESRGDKHMLAWLAGITIAPSINNTSAGHGPKHPRCSFHGIVAKGDILDVMSAKDIKTFKLKARGDAGAAKSELLTAFAALLRQFGMIAELCECDHHLIVTATKAQRNALYEFNHPARDRPQ